MDRSTTLELKRTQIRRIPGKPVGTCFRHFRYSRYQPLFGGSNSCLRLSHLEG